MPNPEIEKILDATCDAHDELIGYLMTTGAGTSVIASRGMVAELQYVTAMVGTLNAVTASLCELTKAGEPDRIEITLGGNGMVVLPVGIGAVLLVHHHGRELSETCAAALNRATLNCARHL